MMKFICFGSGSSGNCYFLDADGYGILIDAGISIRTIKKYFRDYGLPMSHVKALLVTHDHADHVKAAGVASHEFNVPVYATALVHEGIRKNYCITRKVDQQHAVVFEKGTTMTIGPMAISSFGIPHDSRDNNGYFIECGDRTFCLMTDVGHVTDEMADFIHRADYLVIESNYDPTLLEQGPYPLFLKQRIRSGNGHLSNPQAADELARNLRPDARHVWLCHLSDENNHPSLAYKTVEKRLREAGFPVGDTLQLETLKRQSPSPLYELV